MISVETYIARILSQLRLRAPDNTAQPCLAMSLEDGEWYVYVQVRERFKHDYAVEGHSPRLKRALDTVYKSVCRLEYGREQYALADQAYGIA